MTQLLQEEKSVKSVNVSKQLFNVPMAKKKTIIENLKQTQVKKRLNCKSLAPARCKVVILQRCKKRCWCLYGCFHEVLEICFRRASPLLTSKNNLIILQEENIINNTKSFSGEGEVCALLTHTHFLSTLYFLP